MPSMLGGILDKYLEWGLAFLPCHYQSKIPKFKQGESYAQFHKEKPTHQQYREWFADPETNVALICGKVSKNFVALDYDANRPKELFENLERFCHEKYGKPLLELTPVVQSGGGGHHVWLRIKRLPASVGAEKAHELGIPEVKSQGQLITAPPSTHESGRAYKFLNPTLIPILEIDQLSDIGIEGVLFLEEREAQATRTRTRATATEEPHWVAEALKGAPLHERHDTLIKLAGYFRNKHPLEVTLMILETFAARCAPPIPMKELESQVISIYKNPEWEPLNILPSEGPPCYHAMLKGVPEEFRLRACFRLAVIGQRMGIDKGQMKAKLALWDSQTNQSNLGEFTIAMQLRPAYSGKFKIGCPDIEEAGFCSKECPIYPTRVSELDNRVVSTLVMVTGEGAVQLENCTVSDLVKQNSDPPLYSLKINDNEVDFSSEQLFQFAQFKKRCTEVANIVPILLAGKDSSQLRWERVLNRLQETMIVEAVPLEVNRGSEIISALIRYLIHTPKAKNLRDFRAGKPKLEKDLYLFRFDDFINYLRGMRLDVEKSNFVYKILRKMGAENGAHRIDGSEPIWCWHISTQQVQGHL